MEELFKKRINYCGELKDISLKICEDFKLGKFKSNELILFGYEDFNFILQNSEKKYLVKIFSNFRTLEDCYRYLEVIIKAIKNKIATPRIYKSRQDYLYIKEINKTKLRLCVMEFINGKNLFELERKPQKTEEIKFLANQAALISLINHKPKFVYDGWAITNFLVEFEKKGRSLSNDDLKLIEPSVKKFKEIKIEKLPHCFVHGDIIATNVMRDNNNKLWIIDFAVSNYYPRIQELAVLGCNLLFDERNKEKSKENLEIALKEYQQKIKLTKKELDILPVYVMFGHAMHLLSAAFEKNVNNNKTKENKYWLDQGRLGLKQSRDLGFKI